jgi:hypothetical protein
MLPEVRAEGKGVSVGVSVRMGPKEAGWHIECLCERRCHAAEMAEARIPPKMKETTVSIIGLLSGGFILAKGAEWLWKRLSWKCGFVAIL